MALADKLKNPTKVYSTKPVPVWEGPEGKGPQGGVSQSLLGAFLSCRDRFRVKVHEGLGPPEQFSPTMDFGSMWHLCEEVSREGGDWEAALLGEAKRLQRKFPMDPEKVAHWYQICVSLFPEYLDFWKHEKGEKSRQVLESEQVFDVPYTLPYSRRVVRLRGKRDGVSLCDFGYGLGVDLDENKTKSSIDQVKIGRQLKFDLQTIVYLIALRTSYSQHDVVEQVGMSAETVSAIDQYGLRGVRYNVVKRSAHKTVESMLKKVNEDLFAGRGGEWFGRWNVDISARDIETFKVKCLDPALEWLCVWWDSITGKLPHLNALTLQSIINYRHPHGVYNIVDEGGFGEVDSYLETGSPVGLRRISSLFPELEEA